MRITQHYWNQYQVKTAGRANRPRPITREEPRTWDTPNAARETDPVLDRMEKAGDMIAQGLVTLLWVVVPAVVIAQVGFKFGWW